MIARLARHPIVAAALLLALASPPVRHLLQATMTAQMLVQIPLLVGAGALVRWQIPESALASIERWDYRGVTSVVLASTTAAFWMLPRLLDASVVEPMVDTAKYLTVPLFIGLPLALSWPRMNFIVRGLFLLEVTATIFRMGWLYMVWPDRLCNNYLLDDQQRLGEYLLIIGAGVCTLIAAKLLWGRFEAVAQAGNTVPVTRTTCRGLPGPMRG